MSVFPQGNTRLPQDGVLLNLLLYIREDVCTFMVISRRILLSMRKVVEKICRETEIKFYVQQIFFWRKSCCLCDNLENCNTAGKATDDNTGCST